MYNIHGVVVTRKNFWELLELSNDLVSFDKELDEICERKIDNKLVKELIIESKKRKKCNACDGDLVPAISRFGKYLRCTNFPDCLTISKV